MSMEVVTGFSHALVITPSDGTDLAHACDAIYVGGTGTVTVDTVGGETTVLFSAVPVAFVLPVRAKRIRSTGTSATLIVALWNAMP